MLFYIKVQAKLPNRGIQLKASVQYHRESRLLPDPGDHRYTLLDDACLFPGYFRNTATQKGLVLQGDICNNRDQGSDYVSGVQPASKTCLKNYQVSSLLCKPDHCYCSGELEIAEFIASFQKISDPPDLLFQLLLGNHGIPYPESLSEG